jgi:phosphate starvation-inducible protein PhoH and related proteins|tara:strand:+ start:917 stop:1636 length:720 start_codon:yes stop_codon:yes gene_type:complete
MSRAKRKMKYQPQQDNTINFNQALKQRNIELRPKSLNQEKLILNLLDTAQSIVIATGPAGTGKTYLAMLAAIKAFKAGECERIVLTRPAVGVDDEKHGFLPGDLNSKMEPWTRPLFDVLREYYTAKDIEQMLESQTIEISPLAYMRGRTFKDAWIVADEMQNATPSQTKMLMTRIGENSKIIITGDVEQTDRKLKDNGLIDLCTRLETKQCAGIAVCYMSNADIQRHPIIDSVLSLYST